MWLGRGTWGWGAGTLTMLAPALTEPRAERRSLLATVLASADRAGHLTGSGPPSRPASPGAAAAGGSAQVRVERWDEDEHRWLLCDGTAAAGQVKLAPPDGSLLGVSAAVPLAPTAVNLRGSRAVPCGRVLAGGRVEDALGDSIAVVLRGGNRTFLRACRGQDSGTLRSFRVRRRAKVTAAHDIASAKVATLAVGQTIRGFAVRTSASGHARVRCLRGWVSVKSQGGAVLLDPVSDSPDDADGHEQAVLQFRVVRRATVRHHPSRGSSKLEKLPVGVVLDATDMCTDSDGWAWLRVPSGWCCAAAKSGEPQLERVDDSASADLEEETEAASAPGLSWQDITALLEVNTDGVAQGHVRPASEHDKEALLNAVMSCTEAQGRFIAQWIASRMVSRTAVAAIFGGARA